MKKLVMLIVCCLVVFGTSVNVSATSFDLKGTITKAVMDPFAKDLGAVLGGGMYKGSTVGFPGFDVSVGVVAVDKPSIDDVLLPQNTLYLLPYAQVEAGLPMNISVMARGFSAALDAGKSITILGGGVKYKIFGDMILPAVYVIGSYNFVSGFDQFDASTISGNIAITKSLSPIPLTIYVVGGMDITGISAKVLNVGVTGSATSFRVNGGIRLGILPLVYVNADAGYVNSSMSYNGGLGLSF